MTAWPSTHLFGTLVMLSLIWLPKRLGFWTSLAIGLMVLESCRFMRLLTPITSTPQLSVQLPWSNMVERKQALAYVTLLVEEDRHSTAHYGEDVYFMAVRMLGYQLMHANETKTSIPVHCIVTDRVHPDKIATLRSDGFIVDIVEPIESPPWVLPLDHPRAIRIEGEEHMPNFRTTHNYIHLFTKLQVFAMTQYERVLFIDGDHIITGAMKLDNIFNTVEAQTVLTTRSYPDEIDPRFAKMPKTYLFAGVSNSFLEENNYNWPPPYDQITNAGFFMCRPDLKLLEYYLSILKVPRAFNAEFADQSLIDFAHRFDGNMPFARLYYKWNTLHPTAWQYEPQRRAATLHVKLWRVEASPPVHNAIARIARETAAFYGFELTGKMKKLSLGCGFNSCNRDGP